MNSAMKHELRVNLYKEVGELINENINGTYGATQDDVFDFIIDKRIRLYNILKQYKDLE